MMKNRILPILTALVISFVSAHASAPNFYQLKVYHFKNKAQEDRLDAYFRAALVPALHRAGIRNVGVFKLQEGDSSKRIFLFVPFKNLQDITAIDAKLLTDKAYVKDGEDYINALYNNTAYTRIETIVLRAFQGMTEPAAPVMTGTKTDHFYELRSYEGPTEKYYAQKVKMFNEGNEMNIFKRLNFNAVFYADVIAGSHTPNLMYMTSFLNKEDRDQHWKSFDEDAEWKALKAKDEYQHTVSGAEIIFLHPAAYSDL